MSGLVPFLILSDLYIVMENIMPVENIRNLQSAAICQATTAAVNWKLTLGWFLGVALLGEKCYGEGS